MTQGEFVTRIVNDIRALNKDTHVSRRWILRMGKSRAETYVAQKWDEGRLFGELSLFTHISCLPMIRIKSIDCCFAEFKQCGVLMRSKDRIPGMVHANLRPSILQVTSVDDNIHFTYTSLRAYKNNTARRFGSLESEHYYVSDGYIYIPDINIKAVNVDVITLKQKEALALAGCGKEDDDEGSCKSEWDYEFVCPTKLLEAVAVETLNEAVNILKISQDENPNMDSNIRSSTTP